MPPRKRARVSQAASPTSTSQPKTPTPAASSPAKPTEQVQHDPWTDEEEIGLLKGLIHLKPTGIHKHFRILALHQYLLDNHYIHPRSAHTRPPGIWQKLRTLYNLEALDEREDSRQLEKVDIPAQYREKEGSEDRSASATSADDSDVYSEAANRVENADFEMPDEEFAGMKWERRLAEGREGSVEMLPELNLMEEPPVRFTPSFDVGGGEEGGKKTRGKAQPGGTRGKPGAGRRKSTRQVESVAESEEEDEEEENSEEQEEEDEGDDESQESTPAPRSTRTAKHARGRPAGRSRGRGRGRGK